MLHALAILIVLGLAGCGTSSTPDAPLSDGSIDVSDAGADSIAPADSSVDGDTAPGDVGTDAPTARGCDLAPCDAGSTCVHPCCRDNPKCDPLPDSGLCSKGTRVVCVTATPIHEGCFYYDCKGPDPFCAPAPVGDDCRTSPGCSLCPAGSTTGRVTDDAGTNVDCYCR